MAEIMILLVFCLLIAMATFLKREETRRVAAEQELAGAETAKRPHPRRRSPSSARTSRLPKSSKSLSGLSDPQAIDQYWRELVDSRTAVAEIEKNGCPLKELREGMATVATLRSNGIDVEKAIHDSEIVAAIKRAMTKPGEPQVATQAILDAIARGTAAAERAATNGPPSSG